jgi:hypothetical protein
MKKSFSPQARVGNDINALCQVTGYQSSFIEAIDRRMRDAGIWIGHYVDREEWLYGDEEQRALGAIAHTQVASGALLREVTPYGAVYREIDGRFFREWIRTFSIQPAQVRKFS